MVFFWLCRELVVGFVGWRFAYPTYENLAQFLTLANKSDIVSPLINKW